MRAGKKSLGAIIFVLGVTACAPKPAPIPPPPPPPPPPVIVLPPPPPPSPPPMPVPPYWAAPTTVIPPLGVDNVRVTPNRGISREEQIWNLRIAFNSAALSCREPEWSQIIPLYSTFLNVHKARLALANKNLDAEYRKANPGRNGLRVRDTRTVNVYTYFSFRPMLADFCALTQAKMIEANAVPAAGFADYAVGALAEVDGLFIKFFNDYVQYQRDLADWNLRYGPNAVQPGVTPNTVVFAPVTTQPTPVVTQPTPAPTSPAPKPGTKS